MKYADIKSLSKEELAQKLLEEAEALGKLRFAHEITPIENPMRIRVARKTIARLKTEMTARSKAK